MLEHERIIGKSHAANCKYQYWNEQFHFLSFACYQRALHLIVAMNMA
jgi:hypothetical protein